MSLQRQQAFLARLYTDQTLLERVQLDPATVATTFQLPIEWIQEICQGQGDRLRAFQKSLIGKRQKQIRAIFPRSFGLAQELLTTFFSQYAQTHPLQDPTTHTRDALDFRTWLEGRLEPPLAELMRYEWEVAEFHRRGKSLRLRWYTYPVWNQDFSLSSPSQKRWVFMRRNRFFIFPW